MERYPRAYQSPGSTPGSVSVPKADCGIPAQTSFTSCSKHFSLHCPLCWVGLATEQEGRPFAVALQQSGETGYAMDGWVSDFLSNREAAMEPLILVLEGKDIGLVGPGVCTEGNQPIVGWGGVGAGSKKAACILSSVALLTDRAQLLAGRVGVFLAALFQCLGSTCKVESTCH